MESTLRRGYLYDRCPAHYFEPDYRRLEDYCYLRKHEVAAYGQDDDSVADGRHDANVGLQRLVKDAICARGDCFLLIPRPDTLSLNPNRVALVAAEILIRGLPIYCAESQNDLLHAAGPLLGDRIRDCLEFYRYHHQAKAFRMRLCRGRQPGAARFGADVDERNAVAAVLNLRREGMGFTRIAGRLNEQLDSVRPRYADRWSYSIVRHIVQSQGMLASD